VLLFGPPGTGKTLIARACAAQTNATFLKLAGPSLVQMFIGDGAKMVRDAFALAKEKAPAIIFIDEIDAVGTTRRDSEMSGDREVQRTMLELLNQLDGFSSAADVRVIAASNRPDILDPALMRPGRLDRKIEIPLPNDAGRLEILKIHAGPIARKGEIDWDAIVKLSEGFNGADMRNVCTEAGMYAIRDDRDFVVENDFMQAARKTAESKKVESKMEVKL
jgi:26S proteasome regulatory subunit T4